MAAAGGLLDALEGMLSDKPFFRSKEALGLAYQHPERVTDETIETYLRPLVGSAERVHDLERFLAAFDCAQTVAVESKLRRLKAPTLIVWGTDDIYFPVKWSQWLAETIPGTRRRLELPGARLFFPEERPHELNAELRTHWNESRWAGSV
jgi:pimeloyl-ACP methyl ester carboxylesterase